MLTSPVVNTIRPTYQVVTLRMSISICVIMAELRQSRPIMIAHDQPHSIILIIDRFLLFVSHKVDRSRSIYCDQNI